MKAEKGGVRGRVVSGLLLTRLIWEEGFKIEGELDAHQATADDRERLGLFAPLPLDIERLLARSNRGAIGLNVGLV